ncbi:hypothetical protein MSA03_16140 [Microbacterium saccharophilum]|nr:hypothetical protein [Microbacterium saccharophilum]GEP48106.1 hypothetical protein MSA03_16140 [Microbacterium saccharophilum]
MTATIMNTKSERTIAMGKLYYGSAGEPIQVSDRLLAHLKFVATTKLRRQESFALNILHPTSEDAGRTTLWIQPAIPLRFVFSSAEPETLDRELIKQLAEDANTTGGMTLDARETARPLNAVPAAA